MKPVTELVRADGAIQDRSIFWDDEIYQQELANIFARSWQFLTHESLIPHPGDYEVTFMGEDNVIVTRGRDNEIHAFINSCTHRGNTVCFAERGNTRAFACPYHGWVFGIDGSLEHVPLDKVVYRGEIDRSRLGLMKVAKVESYKGFVFGTFDPNAPSLAEYLGEMAWYLDSFMDVPGGMELIGPPMKSILKCNWKFMTENMAADGYHVGWAHAAALEAAGEAAGPLAEIKGLNEFDLSSGMQITTRQGHGFGAIWEAAWSLQGPAYKEWIDHRTELVRKQLGEWRAKFYRAHWNATLFPNCSFLYGTNTWKLWRPTGPNTMETWTWTLVEKEMPDELKQLIQANNVLTFGTAGILESDDGENMEQCTLQNRGYVTRQGSLYAGMARGHERRDPELPGLVSDGWMNETSTRGFYRRWAEMMSGKSWTEIATLEKGGEAA